MSVLCGLVLVQKKLLISVLLAPQSVLDLLHVNNAVDLYCCQSTQTILLIRLDDLLVHFESSPILG